MWSVPDVKHVSGTYLTYLAPRPGLEPGTYGLTETQACQITIKNNDLDRFILFV